MLASVIRLAGSTSSNGSRDSAPHRLSRARTSCLDTFQISRGVPARVDLPRTATGLCHHDDQFAEILNDPRPPNHRTALAAAAPGKPPTRFLSPNTRASTRRA